MADFPFVAANLKNVDSNLSGVRPYRIFDLDGVKVAVIGVTTRIRRRSSSPATSARLR